MKLRNKRGWAQMKSVCSGLLEKALRVPYVQADHRRVVKNGASMNSLIRMTLSQSQCIKIGNALEKILNSWVEDETGSGWKLMDLDMKIVKNEKQKDVLMMHAGRREIVYGEIKANLELDTEKAPKTVNKICKVHNALEEKYPEWTVQSYLVSGRYLSAADIPADIGKRFKGLEERGLGGVIGVNDFLEIAGVAGRFSGYDEYSAFWTQVAQAMFGTSSPH